MGRILVEAHEAVADGRLSDDDFEAFTFGNAARFYARGRPDFFAGTLIERDVKRAMP